VADSVSDTVFAAAVAITVIADVVAASFIIGDAATIAVVIIAFVTFAIAVTLTPLFAAATSALTILIFKNTFYISRLYIPSVRLLLLFTVRPHPLELFQSSNSLEIIRY
jgi:hypothetical protein